jgi:SAM-dependent methyltransferase
MLLKNLARIINSYKFSIITIVFFELLYLLKGYKGNRFNFLNSDLMTDNLPCPYYFLFRIKKTLKNSNFSNFLDLGCGSGRAIDFFNKNFFNKNFIGIEYSTNLYEYCRKIFQKQKNIKIIQEDFTKLNFFQYNTDCYFFNDPLKKNLESLRFIEKIINFSLNKKKIIFIFINCDKSIIEELKNIQCVESFYINNIKGYSIYCLNDY